MHNRPFMGDDYWAIHAREIVRHGRFMFVLGLMIGALVITLVHLAR